MSAVTGGRDFLKSANGMWAGLQFMAAFKAGKGITTQALRTLDTLQRDEWKFFDNELVQEAQLRLRAVADLYAAGLIKRIPNGLGKTVLEYETIGSMDPATVSLDGVTRSENDRLEYGFGNLPLPITHKDFYLNLRHLAASRERGEPIDTTHVRAAGRVVAETAEEMLFLGGKTFAGLPIYGYLTHPSRNTLAFGTNGSWSQTAKTGDDIISDIGRMIQAAEADRFFGPYVIYVGSGMSLKMSSDFKANSDRTIRERILAMDQISDVRVADKLPANTVVMVQMTSDVVQWVEGEPLQTVQWDVHGGFQINFKAFQIGVPFIRADIQGRSGIVHMS